MTTSSTEVINTTVTAIVDKKQNVNISKSPNDIENNDNKDNAMGDTTNTIDNHEIILNNIKASQINEMINKSDNSNIALVSDMNETCENTTTCEKVNSVENIESSSVTEEPQMERIILGVENNTTNTGLEIPDTGNNILDSCLVEPVSNHKSNNDAMEIEQQTNEGK